MYRIVSQRRGDIVELIMKRIVDSSTVGFAMGAIAKGGVSLTVSWDLSDETSAPGASVAKLTETSCSRIAFLYSPGKKMCVDL